MAAAQIHSLAWELPNGENAPMIKKRKNTYIDNETVSHCLKKLVLNVSSAYLLGGGILVVLYFYVLICIVCIF